MLRQGRVLAPVLTLPGTPAAHQGQTLVAFFSWPPPGWGQGRGLSRLLAWTSFLVDIQLFLLKSGGRSKHRASSREPGDLNPPSNTESWSQKERKQADKAP